MSKNKQSTAPDKKPADAKPKSSIKINFADTPATSSAPSASSASSKKPDSQPKASDAKSFDELAADLEAKIATRFHTSPVKPTASPKDTSLDDSDFEDEISSIFDDLEDDEPAPKPIHTEHVIITPPPKSVNIATEPTEAKPTDTPKSAETKLDSLRLSEEADAFDDSVKPEPSAKPTEDHSAPETPKTSKTPQAAKSPQTSKAPQDILIAAAVGSEISHTATAELAKATQAQTSSEPVKPTLSTVDGMLHGPSSPNTSSTAPSPAKPRPPRRLATQALRHSHLKGAKASTTISIDELLEGSLDPDAAKNSAKAAKNNAKNPKAAKKANDTTHEIPLPPFLMKLDPKVRAIIVAVAVALVVALLGWLLIVLFTHEEIAKCTVRFEVSGGSAIPAQEITCSEKISRPADPTRDGFDFQTWTYSGLPFDFDETPINEDIILTAKWTAQAGIETVTITFDTAEGSELEPREVKKGTLTTAPLAPTRDGYKFTGWYLDDAEFNFDETPITQDITLVAHWEKLPAPTPSRPSSPNNNNNQGGGQDQGSTTPPAADPSKPKVSSLRVNNFTTDHLSTYRDIKVTIEPADASTNLIVASDNSSVASCAIDNPSEHTLRCTTKQGGIATITVKDTISGVTTTFKLTVDIATVTSVSITNPLGAELAVGDSHRFTAQIEPSNINVNPYWSSSDTTIATIDQNGILEAKGIGTATITLEAGGKQDTVTVTVSSYRITLNRDGSTTTVLAPANQPLAEPSADPVAGKLYRWLKDGVPYDFNTPVTSNFTLTLEYYDDPAANPDPGA